VLQAPRCAAHGAAPQLLRRPTAPCGRAPAPRLPTRGAGGVDLRGTAPGAAPRIGATLRRRQARARGGDGGDDGGDRLRRIPRRRPGGPGRARARRRRAVLRGGAGAGPVSAAGRGRRRGVGGRALRVGGHRGLPQAGQGHAHGELARDQGPARQAVSRCGRRARGGVAEQQPQHREEVVRW
jgi:hypothetical protein